jgi:cytokinesis protein
MQKRKQAMEESKITRQKAQEASANGMPGQQEEDTAALDTLLEKLRNGDTVGRRAGRARRAGAENQPAISLILSADGTPVPDANDTADIARDMLARLQSDGFQAFTPTSPTTGPKRQTRRRRNGNGLSVSGISELDLASPDVGEERLPDIVAYDPGPHNTDSEAES